MQIVDFLRITKSEFGKKLGYLRPQTIYDAIEGKSKPSFDFFQRFANSEYSEVINLEWLITGKGNMQKKNGKASENTPSTTDAEHALSKGYLEKLVYEQLQEVKGLRMRVEELERKMR